VPIVTPAARLLRSAWRRLVGRARRNDVVETLSPLVSAESIFAIRAL
jgi:hypothetical protein